VVESIAVALLSFIVRDDELDVIRLQPNTLEFFNSTLRQAVDTRQIGAGNWQLEEMLLSLSQLARCDFNKRMMASPGGCLLYIVLFFLTCCYLQ
jgi:hypothetical protein